MNTKDKETDPADALQRYAEFRPTGLDVAGLNADRMGGDYDDYGDDTSRGDWLVCPVTISRDSESLDLSNWAAQEKALAEADPDGNDRETHRFGHWACGWFEIAIVRPGSKAAEVAARLAGDMEGYPVLDEDDLSAREFDAQMEAWDNYAQRDCERDIGELFDIGDYGALDVEWDGAELFRYLMDWGVIEGNGDDVVWSKGKLARLDPFTLLAWCAVAIEGRPVNVATWREPAPPGPSGERWGHIETQKPVLSRRQRAIVNRALAAMPEPYARIRAQGWR